MKQYILIDAFSITGGVNIIALSLLYQAAVCNSDCLSVWKSIFINIAWAECKCINVWAYEARQYVLHVLVNPADLVSPPLVCRLHNGRSEDRRIVKRMISLYCSLLKRSQDFIIPPFPLYNVLYSCLPPGGATDLGSVHCHICIPYMPHLSTSCSLLLKQTGTS